MDPYHLDSAGTIVPEKDPSVIHDDLALALGHCVWPLAAAHVRLHDDIVASLGPAKPEHLLLQGKSWEGATGVGMSPLPSSISKESSKGCVSGCELMSCNMDILSSSSSWQ